jgi:glutathione S-transferase
VLVLYSNPLSSPANKIRFLLHYLAIPYELKIVDLAAGEQRQSDFLKINPYGRVPAIDDNGFRLAESNAILRYLADKHPSSLYSKNLEERAIVEQWLDFAANHISLAISKIMGNTYFYRLKGATKDERSLQDGRLWLNDYLPILEQQLAKQAYIAGNNLTIADFSLLAALDAAELININLTPYPYLKAWRQNLMAESFYQDCHSNYTAAFKAAVGTALDEATNLTA